MKIILFMFLIIEFIFCRYLLINDAMNKPNVLFVPSLIIVLNTDFGNKVLGLYHEQRRVIKVLHI